MMYPAPTYLAGLVTEVNSIILSEIQKEYGNYCTAFKFNSDFKSLGQTWLQEYEDYGGTIWGIDNAKTRLTIFDPFTHGYDGIMGLNEKEDLNATKTTDLLNGTEIIIAFQYSGDEAEYLAEGSAKYEQDYFSWVVVYKHLNNELEEVLSYECA